MHRPKSKSWMHIRSHRISRRLDLNNLNAFISEARQKHRFPKINRSFLQCWRRCLSNIGIGLPQQCNPNQPLTNQITAALSRLIEQAMLSQRLQQSITGWPWQTRRLLQFHRRNRAASHGNSFQNHYQSIEMHFIFSLYRRLSHSLKLQARQPAINTARAERTQ